MSKFDRFDVMLSFCVVLGILFVAQESWLRVHGYGDLPSGCWTFLTAMYAGEILSFSLYRIIKRVTGSAPKTATAKHGILRDVEEETNDGRNQGQTTQP